MYKGPVGIDAINAELRARLNADGQPIPGTAFRLHDKVLQTKNTHERLVMNGETGVLVHHDDDRDHVILATDDGRRVLAAGPASWTRSSSALPARSTRRRARNGRPSSSRSRAAIS